MARPISLRPSTQPTVRNGTRLLAMVHELHKAGYQRIRFTAGMSPSGMHWRCTITDAGNIADDRISLRNHKAEIARYSSADTDRYFGWADASGKSARELAALFVERFPEIVAKGDGRDWAYAGWLSEVLNRAELAAGGVSLPVYFADYPIDLDPEWLSPPP